MKPLPPLFTRAGFREAARSIAATLDGVPVGALAPTEAPGGALGWRLCFTRPATVAGCTVPVRYTLTATVVGSDRLPAVTPPASHSDRDTGTTPDLFTTTTTEDRR